MPFNLSIFHRAVKAVEEEGTSRFTSLAGSSSALFFSMLKGRYLVICHSEDSAQAFYSDSTFWSELLGAERPALIPLKGDPLRLKNLRDVYKGEKTRLIASVEAALSPLWHVDNYPLLCLKNNSTADRDDVVEKIRDYGYVSVPVVSGYGEFSIRGGILDVFPPGEEFPVRIEFFGDDIESLRYFEIDTQRTIEEIEQVFIGPAVEPAEGTNLINMSGDGTIILHEPDDIKKHYPEFIRLCEGKKTIHFTSLPLKGEGFNFDLRGPGGFGLLPGERENLENFVRSIKELRQRYFILIISASAGQARRLRELCIEENLEVPILENVAALNYTGSPVITTGDIRGGFVCDGSIILAAGDIFGKKPVFRPLKKSRVSTLISSIEDFKEGDYLVHTGHGIGKFLGIRKQKIEDYEGDFIVMEYLGSDKLYVPLERINLIQKYHAPEGIKPRVDKLGGKSWQKTKQRVRQKVKDMAEKLLSLYARRSTVNGFAFSGDTELHREFDGFFTYEE
ncbi:MAG: hypothetical protein KAQ85_05315, partial [Thermodesulfovibrionia bacterium]|nr:hypothetical protein [Thermodesulfovibrionia bacterium]